MNTLTIPGDPRAVDALFKLKGAPLSCLIGLYICHPHPVGRRVLEIMTGYHKDAVTRAMYVLTVTLGYASRLERRYEAWCLTTTGVQLRLPLFSALFRDNGPRALVEGDFSALPGSSSSLSPLFDLEMEKTTTTTPEREGDFSALPQEATDLIAKYLRGCKTEIAQAAVRTALERGDTLKEIESEMILWVMYGESPLGYGIHGAARHAAARIRDGEKCPDYLFRVDPQHPKFGDAWKRWKEANEPWLERLDELDETAPAPRPTITGKLANRFAIVDDEESPTDSTSQQ